MEGTGGFGQARWRSVRDGGTGAWGGGVGGGGGGGLG